MRNGIIVKQENTMDVSVGARKNLYPGDIPSVDFIFIPQFVPCIIVHKGSMKKTQKPNGKNIETALELLELSLLLKTAVKKAKKKT